jgi:hypothetical protein
MQIYDCKIWYYNRYNFKINIFDVLAKTERKKRGTYANSSVYNH